MGLFSSVVDMPGDESIAKLFSSSLEEIFGGGDLLVEVAREMIKEEIKDKVRASLEENPELKREFKDAVALYYESKIRQTLAAARIAKASDRPGL